MRAPVAPLVLVALLVAAEIGAWSEQPQALAPQAVADVSVDGGVDISVTTEGLIPARAVMTQGQSARFVNDSPFSTEIRLGTGDAVTDISSGSVPPGGAYVFSTSAPGVYPVTVGTRTGTLVVGAGFTGIAPDELFAAHVPDVLPPPFDEADLGEHPRFGLGTSLTRLLVGFVATATVGDVTAALADVEGAIIGGTGDTGILTVAVADSSDMSALDAAIATLRANPTVDFAAFDAPVVFDSLPEPPVGELISRDYTWSDPATTPPEGSGGNWHHEAIRTPQAWNLREAIRDRGAPVKVAVVDNGYRTDHPELSRLTVIEDACYTDADGEHCAVNEIASSKGDHGTHVSGIVGADFGNPDGAAHAGATGVDPNARLLGYDWDSISVTPFIDRILDDPFHDGMPIRVFNFSFGWGYDAEKWSATYGGLTCGPGFDDDDDATGPCLPSTQDDYLDHTAHSGRAFERVAKKASDRDVLIAASAGNDGAKFCTDGATVQATASAEASTCQTIRLGAIANGPYAFVAQNWTDPSRTNPMVIVEALGGFTNEAIVPTFEIASFSQKDGDISAPGYILSTCYSEMYCGAGGTSQATPIVAGVASMLAGHSSNPGLAEVRAALLGSAVSDTTGGAAPRVDAFGALLSLAGAAAELVDVNDSSSDGFRRFLYDSDGNVVSGDPTYVASDPEAGAAPDGRVDIRDFRRLRDSWLYTCAISEDAGDLCPPKGDIALDGATRALAGYGDDHSKYDLNLDGCVDRVELGFNVCQLPEAAYPRVDFNGDGLVRRTADAPMPIGADGAPLPSGATTTPMSDLDVLKSQWSPPHPGGYDAIDLELLWGSGDIEVDVAGLLATGVTDVVVRAVDATGVVASEPVAVTATSAVLTVRADDPVTIEAVAETASGAQTFAADDPVDVGIGEDKTVRMCGGIDVRLGSSLLRVDGTDATTVAVELDPCGTHDLEGTPITLSINPTGAGHASLDATGLVADAAGLAHTTVTAGFERAVYQIEATAELPAPNGPTSTTGSATLTVDGRYAYDVIAEQGAGGLRLLGDGPSIDDDGDVAFVAVSGTESDPVVNLWINRDNAVVVALDSGVLTADETWFPEAFIGDDGSVWGLTERVDHTSPIPVVHRRVIRLDEGAGPSQEVAAARSSATEPAFESVGLPVANAAGTVIFSARHGGDAFGSLTTPDPTSPTGYYQGPGVVGVDTSHADLADDATAVAQIVVQTGLDARGLPILEDAVIVGSEVLDSGNVLAQTASNGWTALGSHPAVDRSGDVVVFTGTRGNGNGLFLAVRNGGYGPSTPILGENATEPIPELNVDGPGEPRWFSDIVVDAPVEVLRRERGPAGLDGDVLTVVFFGTPSGSGPGFTAASGMWTVDVELALAGGTVVPLVGEPIPAVQIGDHIAGAEVTRIGAHDPLGADETAADGHRLAFWADTDAGQRIIRASRFVTAPAASGFDMEPISAVRPARLQTIAATTPAPIVSAMVVSDLDPEVGQTITVRNRSLVDGSGATASLDRGDGTAALNVAFGGAASFSYSAEGTHPAALTVATVAQSLTAVADVVASPPPNRAPTAHIAGPYDVGPGEGVTIDGSGSSDPDGVADIVSYAWDFDGDRDYDDASGPSVSLTRADLDTIFCGGTCSDGESRAISLRVTDSAGHLDSAATHVTVFTDPRDFTIALDPAVQPVNPGTTTSFAVKLTSEGGFADTVSLSIAGLPSGWTSSFSPSALVPNGTSQLRVTPPADAPEVEVSFTVTAAGGGITHTAGAAASVEFALVPICTTSVRGTIYDEETGAPVPNAKVTMFPSHTGFPTWTTTTGADGTYFQEDVSVVDRMQVVASAEGYYQAGIGIATICGADNVADVELLFRRYGSILARIVEGIPDPDDLTQSRDVAPTDTPIPFAKVSSFTADADGYYLIENIPLSSGNLPRRLTVSGGSPDGAVPGYWGNQDKVTISADTVSKVVIPLVEKCAVDPTVEATGVAYDEDGQPIEDLFVFLGSRYGDRLDDAWTAADGTFSLGPVPFSLGHNNSLRGTFVTTEGAIADGSRLENGARSPRMDAYQCGQRVTGDVRFDLTWPPPPLVENVGSITGVVTDQDTGAPIANAEVWATGSGLNTSTNADASGVYRFDDVLVGTGDVIEKDVTVGTQVPGYWNLQPTGATMLADQTVVADVTTLKKQLSSITGVVVDKATGQPIHGATVSFTSVRSAGTDEQGRFALDNLEPGDLNTPLPVSVVAYKSYPTVGTPGRFFHQRVDTVLEPGQTSEVRFELVQACDNAVITGIVKNAATGLPLEGATVGVNTGSDGRVLTGADGLFTITGVYAGFDNKPASVKVTASKTGFVSQTKTVTVFCGGTISLSFGSPEEGFGAIAGTVTDSGGGPIVGATLVASNGASTTSDANGAYRLDGIPTPVLGDATVALAAVEPVRNDQIDVSVVVTDGGLTVHHFVFGAPNAAPVALDQAVNTAVDTAVGITLGGTDGDGDALAYSIVSHPSSGTLTGAGAGRVYEPGVGFTGVDTFTFVVTDGSATSAPATVTINVTDESSPPANTAPTADDQAVSTNQGSPLAVTLTGADADGDPIAFSVLTQPEHGALSGTAPQLTYTPVPGFAGTDHFTFEVSDGIAKSAPATVTITTVASENQVPAAVIATLGTVAEGSVATLDGSGSSDPDGDVLSFMWSVGGAGYAGARVDVTYFDDAVVPVVLTVDDGRGGTDDAATELVVTNVAPSLTATSAMADVALGQPVSVELTAADPGADDTHTLAVDWGDGTSLTVPIDGAADLGHTYAEAGSYTASFEVCDDDGGCDRALVGFTVAPPAVVLSVTAPPVAHAAYDAGYTITVDNTSPTGAPDLVLDTLVDTLLGDLTGVASAAGCGTLAAGASCTFALSRTVGAGDPDPLTASTTATYHPVGLTVTVTDSAVHTTDLFQPSATVLVTNSPEVEVGETTTYNYGLHNTSSPEAPPLLLLSMTDTVLGSLTAAAEDAGCGVLAAGASCAFTVEGPVADASGPVAGTVVAELGVTGFELVLRPEAGHTISILPPAPTTRSQLTPTGTECEDFAGGTASDLDELTYTTSHGSTPHIRSVAPGAFIYWAEVIAPAESFSVAVEQVAGEGWARIALTSDGARLHDDACAQITKGVTRETSGDGTHVVIHVDGAVAGTTYYVTAKYLTSSLKGSRPGPGETAEYTFRTLLDAAVTNEESLLLRPR